jgi:hypothetical protein
MRKYSCATDVQITFRLIPVTPVREAQSAGRSRDQTNTRLLFQLLKRDRHR